MTESYTFPLQRVIFVSGIDTDAGKTYATAHLARLIAATGRSVITQKFIQTGCESYSEDIEAHRRLMDMDLTAEDLDHTTSPIVFRYPASAQLAAAMDGRDIDLSEVDRATEMLLEKYDVVLIEGAGGLMVPVTDTYFTIDYVASRQLPVALVTNSVLGSINHTILSMEALASRKIKLHSVLYNTYFDSRDSIIAADTRRFTEQYTRRYFPGVPVIDVPVM